MEPELSVVIMTMNEGLNIGPVLDRLQACVQQQRISAEYIIIDGNSRDATREEAQKRGATVVLQQGPGYASALREGFSLARAPYVLTLDADGSHPPEQFPALWEKRRTADLIIASRFVEGGDSAAPRHRQWMSRILSWSYRFVLTLPLSDISSGYRLYRRAILTPSRYRSQRFDVLSEIAVRAYTDGFSVAEVPLRYEERASGESHADLLTFSIAFIKTLCRMWVLRNLPDAADYEARAIHSRIPLQRYWQERRLRLIQKFSGIDAGAEDRRVLDVGCGSSAVTQSSPRIFALDIEMPKLRFIRGSNPLRICADARRLPFPDGSFHNLIHSQLIDRIPFDAAIFEEMRRVLAPGGILVLSTLDHGRPWWGFIGFFYRRLLPNTYATLSVTKYSAQKLGEVLREHGFVPEAQAWICGAELIIRARRT